MADNNESVSLNDTETESMIMSGVNAKSIPTINKVSLDDLFQLMKVQSNELNAKFDAQNVKFDEKFNKLDEKFNAQSAKFDEVKNEIKKQNCNYEKQMKEMHARFDKTKEKIVALVNEKFDRQKNKVDKNYESRMGVENLSLIHI